ncbi:hypothetical protein KHA96_01055 [Bacillus sp. FJAT-49711]|uniref:hypothetical protein n=1 Tax=Bacillus sp. FJAT-49711 TaxID=2833585 RepID=UPI001BC9A96C|nr:hypothetical protein [Bacillus sp. FJAT-49711]MBS4216898.1 hypothetical protein [Bacillus sp. FJAT-49711]
MKKKRLLLYLIGFILAIGIMTIYQKSTSVEFRPERVTSYINGIRMGVQDLYKKVPINDIRENNTISEAQLDHLLGGIERVYSSYIELKTMAITFDYWKDQETKTEIILDQVLLSFQELKTASSGDIILTKTQMNSIEELYKYLWDLYQLDLYDKDLDKILLKLEEVSENHEILSEVSFLS